MGEESQEDEGSDPSNIVFLDRDDSASGSRNEGCRSEKKEEISPGVILGRTLRHFFPDFSKWISSLPDGRDQSRITYHQRHMIWSGMFIFLLHLESRRQFRFERETESFRENMLALAGTSEDAVAHPDTLENYLRLLPHASLADLPASMIQRLIRMKALDAFRLSGCFLIAIDGSGQLVFDERHCPHCLHRTSAAGKTIYFHPILEAKLVTSNGFAFSVATEFIENPEEKYDKQDCELKAFYRLEKTLKARFPRTPLCLLFDAIYANKPVFDIARNNGWKFMVTFKEGSLPALYEEAMNLRNRPVNACRQMGA